MPFSEPTMIKRAFIWGKVTLFNRKYVFWKIFWKKFRKNLVVSRKVTTFASQFRNHSTDALRKKFWRDGRVVDCIGLENRRTERYRGFESLSLRITRWFSAGFFFYTQFYTQKLATHRMSQAIKYGINRRISLQFRVNGITSFFIFTPNFHICKSRGNNST